MKLPVARFLALAATALTLMAQQPALAHRLFSSVAMTKAQKNSSTATDSGLYCRNADGQWTLFGPRITIAALTARPDDASTLFASSSEGVVRSRDGGATWRKVTGWDIGDVRCLAFDPKNPSLAYGASAWGPIRSTDGGENWKATHDGLAKLYCQTVVADPRESGH